METEPVAYTEEKRTIAYCANHDTMIRMITYWTNNEEDLHFAYWRCPLCGLTAKTANKIIGPPTKPNSL